MSQLDGLLYNWKGGLRNKIISNLVITALIMIMAIGVVEFSREGYKIRKVFA